MTKDDLTYICMNTGSLAGIPVRLYENGQLVLYHSLIRLIADPIALYEEEILKIQDHVTYYATPEFDYYGIVNAAGFQIVLGPTRQVDSSLRELKRMAFLLNIPAEKRDDFASSMQKLVRFPLDSLLEMLLSINFMANGEKLYLSDITMSGPDIAEVPDPALSESVSSFQPETQQQEYYTSYDLEKELMDMVRQGNVTGLEAWMKEAPAIRAGILSQNELRQYKNLMVVSATLSCRSAISGGLDERTAFLLSDAYIQQVERLRTPAEITRLQAVMLMDFTQRVKKIRIGENPTDLSVSVASYVQNHLDEAVRIEDLSRYLFMSRSRLQARFKEETGQTLTEFILRIKIEEAKRLLLYSHQSVSMISNYLAFSSQSHLTRVFKHYTGLTPAAYRRGKTG